ncbi:MAG: hypothetical protein KDA21_07625, partial [Phycisphaerales bacterium]|nr:hypothetical protein [Phycisphaerales bacterium]
MVRNLLLALLAALLPGQALGQDAPDPHTRPADGFPIQSPAVARGSVATIEQSFSFDRDDDGVIATITMMAQDLNGDGVIVGSSGYYSLPESEVSDLRITFWRDRFKVGEYDNVTDGIIDYPFFYLSWTVGEEAPDAWDLGADPGWYTFAGPIVTPVPGAWFTESATLYGGTFDTMSSHEPNVPIKITSVTRRVSASTYVQGWDLPDCLITCEDAAADSEFTESMWEWTETVSATSECPGTCTSGFADCTTTIQSVVEGEVFAIRGSVTSSTSGIGVANGEIAVTATLDVAVPTPVTLDLETFSPSALIQLGPFSSEFTPGQLHEFLLPPGTHMFSASSGTSLDFRLHLQPRIYSEERRRGYPTIQAAINQINGFGSVSIGPGVYPGRFTVGPEVTGIGIESRLGPEWTAVQINAPIGFPGIEISGVEGCYLRGLSFSAAPELMRLTNTAPYIEDCVFHDFAFTGVAAVNASPTFHQVKFRARLVFLGPPAHAYIEEGSQPVTPVFRNCLFHHLDLTTNSAVLSVGDQSDLTMINCTVAANAGSDQQAVFLLGGDSTITARNSIFWNNNGGLYSGPTAPDFEYCLFPGGTGTNLDADPLFADPAADDFALTIGSPAIDAGDNGAWPSGSNGPLVFVPDLRYQPRFVDDFYTPDSGAGSRPVIDLGPLEHQGDLIHVPEEYGTVQAAINAAADGQTIVLQRGLYREHIDLLGKAIAIRSVDPLLDAPQTTLFGDLDFDDIGDGTVITCVSGEGPNTLIEGLSIRRGESAFGGGARIVNGSPIFRRCRFLENTGNFGAAVSQSLSTARFEHCEFFDNVSTKSNGGGAAWNEGGAPTFVNCLIHHNTASGSGVAFTNINSDLTLLNSTVADNTTAFWTILNFGTSSLTMVNSIAWNPEGVVEISGTGHDVRHSIIRFSYPGIGNLSTDPMFAGGFTPYALMPGSPAIDAGDNTAVP